MWPFQFCKRNIRKMDVKSLFFVTKVIAIFGFVMLCFAVLMDTNLLTHSRIYKSGKVFPNITVHGDVMDHQKIGIYKSDKKFQNITLHGDVTDHQKKGNTHVPINETARGWFTFTCPELTMFVHSAFYDDRSAERNIRILVVSDMSKASQIYCNAWYQGQQNQRKIKATKKVTYIHKTDGGIYKYVKSRGIFKEYVVTCSLMGDKETGAITHVTIWAEQCSQSKLTLPVTIPEKPKTKLPIGVCVSVSYGHIDTAQFVEWIELNKIFGVSEFNIYGAFFSNQTRQLLDYYKTTPEMVYNDMLTVIPVSSDIKLSRQFARLNQVPSLNHCMYTNLHRYKYIVVIDFDEIIVPIKHMTYVELIKQLNQKFGNKNDDWVGYSFKNVYFFHESPQDDRQPKFLPMLQHKLKATKTNPSLIPKCIINPKWCIVVANHNCVSAFHNKQTRNVDQKVAVKYHFRKCPDGFVNCEKELEHVIKDDILLRYKEQLINATTPVLKKLNYF